jgi:MFS family permease
MVFKKALVCRFGSWKIFKKQYEPKIKLKKSYYFSFTAFLINGRKTNFGKFTIFRALFTFASSIASPLFVVYLLRYLGFNYSTYMVIILAGTIFSLLVMELWGKMADKYGNYRVLIITSILIPLIPILWIVSPSPIYLIFVPTLISGISWAGFNLASGNFIYDNVSQERRGLAVSYFNMLHGIGLFLGAGLGAILIRYLSVSFIQPILLIFIISGIARMLVVGVFIPHLREIRKAEKFEGKKAFRNIVYKQFRHTLAEEAHEIVSLKKYLRT